MKIRQSILIFAIWIPSAAWAATPSFVQVDDQLIDSHYFDKNSELGAKPKKVVLWRDGVLPIRFLPSVEPEIRETFMKACAEWASAAAVRCQEGKYKGAELVVGRSYFGISSGCWSMLGSERYFLFMRRRMNLGPGCEDYATILHEIGHAFGLTHEHQRMDRDEYIEIRSENVSDPFLGFGLKLNFAKQDTEQPTPYDFFSIMHYSRKAGSKNGLDTLVPRPGFESMIHIIGRQTHLSAEDRRTLASLYGPPKETPEISIVY
ncbi:MAG: hypothetical protein KGQ59_05600 [Bdellovibrionales bacterium]|nr:hypothetical protein [Bdellovibrionales bacterium]